MFDTVKTNFHVNQYKEETTEEASEIILNGWLKLGFHEYTYNFQVARYIYI